MPRTAGLRILPCLVNFFVLGPSVRCCCGGVVFRKWVYLQQQRRHYSSPTHPIDNRGQRGQPSFSTSVISRSGDMGEEQERMATYSSMHRKTGDKHIGYGTTGFRDKAFLLDHIMFRMGIVAALRSKQKQASIGVMITASHNPEADNGVKLVDPEGEMLEREWEEMSTEIANAENEELPGKVLNLINKFSIDLSRPTSVFLARDTRESGSNLANAVIDGVICIDGHRDGLVDYGIATTPVLHYLIVCKNGNGAYGQPTIDGYYTKLSSAFKKLVGNEARNNLYIPTLMVDCANGVGAIAMREFMKKIGKDTLDITLVNDGSSGALNSDCGADYVKIQQTGPLNIEPYPGLRCATLDGDADRLIYFYFDNKLDFHMLDGDKISLLFAEYLKTLVQESNLNLKLGVVQTAYANGSSTRYVEEVLGMPVSCVPTGIKHLHHAAQEFDIGVYFEANGHGTVNFSKNACNLIKATAETRTSPAAIKLAIFMDVINSTVGDAISDLLAVEAILHSKGWDAPAWEGMYTDLPNRQLKVIVADREVIKNSDAGRICTSPPGIQAKIHNLIALYPNGRSFVRPSGTEDIVRVYAEADTQANADALGYEVALAVYELCGGQGPPP